jgi:transketolase
LIDHYTFVICGDGDLMEGISHEAASLAGHLGLGRLIYIYDDNHITIDGPTEIALSDDAVKRFDAYGWHTENLGEVANDTDALEAAVRRAMAVEDKPSFLQLRSHIGWPAPHMTDNPKAHGDPFPPEEIAATKEILGLPADQTFWVPEDVISYYRTAGARGRPERDSWVKHFDSRLPAGSQPRAAWDAQWRGDGLAGFEQKLPIWKAGEKLATRAALKSCLNAVVAEVPGLVSGGADLTGNTGTALDGEARQSSEDPEGRLFSYGVREHGMGGVMVGMARHGGVTPVGGTFFCFSDYMRGAVRLAALSKTKVIYSWTHDSVGLGQDGPTHQPVEQLAAMRAMPNLLVIRPADANETGQALKAAIDFDGGPTALILTRQTVPVLEGTAERAEQLHRGAYVLSGDAPGPDIVLIGTGSEVSLCVDAAKLLEAEGLHVRVVSMPSWELFEQQGKAYQREVLGSGAPALAVEAAASFGWTRWADASVSIDQFGASGPGEEVLAHFGFTPENVASKARALLQKTHDDEEESK